MSPTYFSGRYYPLLLLVVTSALAFSLSGCFDSENQTSTQNQASLMPAPAAPKEIAAVSGDTQAFLTWPRVDSAESYSLYITSEPGVTPQTYASLADGSLKKNIVSPHIVRDLDNSKTYYAVLTSENTGGESSASKEITISPVSGVPLPPAPKLKSARAGSNRVNLSWKEIPGALNYRIYITYPENAEGELAGTTKHLTAKGNAYIVKELENGKTYAFSVSAENEAGESELSSSLKATPKVAKVRPATPRNLSVADNKDGSITVDWDVNDSVRQYDMFVSTDAGISSRNFSRMPEGKAVRDVSPPYTMRNLNPKTYYLVLNAKNGSNSSRDTKAVGVSVAPKPAKKKTAAQAPVAKVDDSLEPIDSNRPYEKLGKDGRVLDNQRKKYKYQPWACVRHKETGRIWETKTNVGDFRDGNIGFPWTEGSNTQCKQGVCTVDQYVAKVNEMRLCGFDDWRMPTKKELKKLRDKKQVYPNPKINIRFFPNTGNRYYWSGTTHKHNNNSAWFVFFSDGSSYFDIKTNPMSIRLVREERSSSAN